MGTIKTKDDIERMFRRSAYEVLEPAKLGRKIIMLEDVVFVISKTCTKIVIHTVYGRYSDYKNKVSDRDLADFNDEVYRWEKESIRSRLRSSRNKKTRRPKLVANISIEDIKLVTESNPNSIQNSNSQLSKVNKEVDKQAVTQIANKSKNDLITMVNDLIKSEDIRKWTLEKLEGLPSYFWECAASSSGKYHPPFALGTSGLVRHTMAAMAVANIIAGVEYLQIDNRTRSKMIAALALHDGIKRGADSLSAVHTVKDHARLAAEYCFKESINGLPESDLNEIAGYVRSHMGQWGANKPGSLNQALVHLADLLASRKFINVNFDALQEAANKN